MFKNIFFSSLLAVTLCTTSWISGAHASSGTSSLSDGDSNESDAALKFNNLSFHIVDKCVVLGFPFIEGTVNPLKNEPLHKARTDYSHVAPTDALPFKEWQSMDISSGTTLRYGFGWGFIVCTEGTIVTDLADKITHSHIETVFEATRKKIVNPYAGLEEFLEEDDSIYQMKNGCPVSRTPPINNAFTPTNTSVDKKEGAAFLHNMFLTYGGSLQTTKGGRLNYSLPQAYSTRQKELLYQIQGPHHMFSYGLRDGGNHTDVVNRHGLACFHKTYKATGPALYAEFDEVVLDQSDQKGNNKSKRGKTSTNFWIHGLKTMVGTL